MNIKTIISIFSILVFTVINAQEKVGINTDTPTKDLDVNGSARVREYLPKNEWVGRPHVLVADYDGSIGEVKFDLQKASMKVASVPVVKEVTAQGETSDIDLGLEISTLVPKHKKANILIFYSVPVGIDFDDTDDIRTNRFYGVKLYKSVDDGGAEEEQEAASVLFRATKAPKNDNVSAIAKNFSEEVINDTDTDMQITYKLKGVVWQKDNGKTTYRFNMKNADESQNDHWGKAIITQQTYLQKIN